MTIDDPKLQLSFEKMGITDPEQQQAILDFIDQMADIVMYILFKQQQNEKPNSL